MTTWTSGNCLFSSRVIQLLICPVACVVFLAAGGCDQGRRSAKNRPAADIKHPDIDFPGLQLRPGESRSSYTLIGRIRNKSKQLTLEEVRMLITMEDVLVSGAATSAAETVLVLNALVPPGRSRDINERITFGRLPSPRGRHEWNYVVREVRAK